MDEAVRNGKEITDAFEEAPCGYVLTTEDGKILRANATFRGMTGCEHDLSGQRFQDLFTAGARVYFETHLRPLLNMQGAVSEIALDLRRVEDEPLPILLNARVLASRGSEETTVAWAAMAASDRRLYERELLAGRKRAEEAERAAQDLNERLAAANEELQNALTELRESNLYIRKLEGILPICIGCKSVRSDDDQEWLDLDRYLMRTGAVSLSHSICPNCVKHYEP